MKPVGYFIENLQLQEHPEGGYFKETYRAAGQVLKEHLPFGFGGNRSFSTSIYYLLEGTDFSAFHRIKSDELWHFYYGCALDIYVIYPEGGFKVFRLGPDLENGESFQVVVEAGAWFASQPVDRNSYSLVGCTVSPGFDFNDFELASAKNLLQLLPHEEKLINRLCRK
jgi:predicted cupin superfamily sugar epimerase